MTAINAHYSKDKPSMHMSMSKILRNEGFKLTFIVDLNKLFHILSSLNKIFMDRVQHNDKPF